MGGHVVHELRGRDLPVRCLVRDLRRGAKLGAWGCELAEGDLTDPQSLRAAAAGPEHADRVRIVDREGGAVLEMHRDRRPQAQHQDLGVDVLEEPAQRRVPRRDQDLVVARVLGPG